MNHSKVEIWAHLSTGEQIRITECDSLHVQIEEAVAGFSPFSKTTTSDFYLMIKVKGGDPSSIQYVEAPNLSQKEISAWAAAYICFENSFLEFWKKYKEAGPLVDMSSAFAETLTGAYKKTMYKFLKIWKL